MTDPNNKYDYEEYKQQYFFHIIAVLLSVRPL